VALQSPRLSFKLYETITLSLPRQPPAAWRCRTCARPNTQL